MNKKFKLYAIVSITAVMLVSWAVIFFSHSVGKPANNWWQVGMGLSGLFFAICGITTAAKWNWLKSGVGRAVFFLSLGLLMWTFGQMMWTYYLFQDPTTQNPPQRILDVLDYSAIPLFLAGTIMLSKATGARYGLKTTLGKVLIVVIPVLMAIVSYYYLVVVARGGTAYFNQPLWNQFFDLGYSIGDAIIATIAIVIFGLSWKVLGGRFKLPITVILFGLVLLYFADSVYSYRAGTNEYFNGDVADLLYMLTIATLGLGLSMLDPGRVRKAVAPAAAETPAVAPASEPEPQVADHEQTPTSDSQPPSHESPTPSEPASQPVSTPAPRSETADNIEEESL